MDYDAIAAHFLFGESVNPVRWAGIGFINGEFDSGGIEDDRKARHPDHRSGGVPQGPQDMARDGTGRSCST